MNLELGLGTRGGFALVVVAGVVVPGVTNYALSTAGFHTLGSVAWAVGYATMAVLLWYGWVRPIDPTGPDPSAPEAGESTADADSSTGSD